MATSLNPKSDHHDIEAAESVPLLSLGTTVPMHGLTILEEVVVKRHHRAMKELKEKAVKEATDEEDAQETDIKENKQNREDGEGDGPGNNTDCPVMENADDTQADELDFGCVHRVILPNFMSKQLATSFSMILPVVLALFTTLTDGGVIWQLISAGLWPHAMAMVLTSWGTSVILLP